MAEEDDNGNKEMRNAISRFPCPRCNLETFGFLFKPLDKELLIFKVRGDLPLEFKRIPLDAEWTYDDGSMVRLIDLWSHCPKCGMPAQIGYLPEDWKVRETTIILSLSEDFENIPYGV